LDCERAEGYILGLLKKQKLSKEDSKDARKIWLLASGPSSMVTSWQAYDINGYTFYTNAKDNKSVSYHNSGIWLKPVDANGHAISDLPIIEFEKARMMVTCPSSNLMRYLKMRPQPTPATRMTLIVRH
jgi:hypothetical protein